jgi:hypothetical protein
MNRILPLTIAATALVFSFKGYAADDSCNTYASGFTENAETYFHLDTGSGLNGQSDERVTDLAERLQGKWRGHSSAINCVGHYLESTAQKTDYAVEAEVIHKFNGALKLEAEQSGSRSVKLTKLFLAPELKRQNAPDWRHYSIEFLSPNRMRFNHKYRARSGVTDPGVPSFFPMALQFPARAECTEYFHRRSVNRPTDVLTDALCSPTRLIHEIKEIELQEDQLTVHHRLFMNGLFVSQEKWMLNRS